MNPARLTASTFALIALTAVAGSPLPALANTTVHEFGQLLDGASAEGPANFAALSQKVVENDTTFTLGTLGTRPFDGAISQPLGDWKGDGAGGGWEFRFDFTGRHKPRLMNDEGAGWALLGGAAPLSGIGANAQGLDYGESSVPWYSAVAVPEPGAYAMFLSGLVVLVVPALRRRGRFKG